MPNKEYEMLKEMGLLNRVGIPEEIVKKMALSQGDKVSVWMEGGIIMIRPVEDKCDLCQVRGDAKRFVTVHSGKRICSLCADAIRGAK